MQVISVPSSTGRKNLSVVVVPVWHDKKKPIVACDGQEFGPLVKFPLSEGDFCGKEGETLLLYRSKGKEKRVLLLGLGAKKSCAPEILRRSYASAVKALCAKKMHSANVLLPKTELMGKGALCQGIFEGVMLTGYTFEQLKGKSSKEESGSTLEKVCFCGVDKEGVVLLKKAQIIVQSVNFVRDLVNGNSDDIHVDTLKKIAADFHKKYSSVTTTILDKKALEKEKMGLILAVGRAAARDPALIILEYKGMPSSKEKIAIVGKGITYDTGGLDIKTSGMETMKADMAGAAVAIGIIRAAAELKLKINLVSVLAVAENAIGPASYKPGDVYCSRIGKTVEISNTDAEGRLVLADAVSYTEEKYAPKLLLDFATLTGGIIIALGEEATGLFSNNDALAEALEKSGERTHERLWRLPLYPEYKDYLKSSIADIKNCGPRKASSGTGATFIQQFIKSVPWAHLDIAGTAYLSELKAPYHTTPATGVGIRMLVDFFEHCSEK
jgi:leucyl aminopeptidase